MDDMAAAHLVSAAGLGAVVLMVILGVVLFLLVRRRR